jgi:cbb3-type cytochrome oxidase subunit 3
MWLIVAEIVFALVLVALIYWLTLPRKQGDADERPPDSSD